jgi:hypothetical protein
VDEDEERQASRRECDESHDDIAARGQREAREESAPRPSEMPSHHARVVRVYGQRGAEQAHEAGVE